MLTETTKGTIIAILVLLLLTIANVLGNWIDNI